MPDFSKLQPGDPIIVVRKKDKAKWLGTVAGVGSNKYGYPEFRIEYNPASQYFGEGGWNRTKTKYLEIPDSPAKTRT